VVVVRDDVTAFDGRRMPSLNGATEWLNSEPLGPAGLRGHVVLITFWTFTCINIDTGEASSWVILLLALAFPFSWWR
jgi:hypothetical protein